MKKRQRVILLSSLLLASSLALTINYAFCSPFIRDNAGSINIGITGIALGDADYYVFFGDGDKQALEKDEDGKYTTNITVDTAKDYSYKITDKFGDSKYQSDTFNLGITGTFNLSFDTTNLTSSLTYSFSLVDEGNAFGASSDALPYCSFSSDVVNPTDFYIVGDIASKPEGVTGSWDKESGVRMTTNPGNTSDLGMAQHVHLTAGNEFKIKSFYYKDGTPDEAYEGYSKILVTSSAYSDFYGGNGGNIVANTGVDGYYDVYLTKDYNIAISKSASQEAEPIKIQATSYDEDEKTTTYTLDATKYASASTYISFSDNGNTKGTQSIAVSDLITTNSTLTMKKYLYLDTSQTLAGGNKWSLSNATFKAFTSDTEYIDMKLYKGEVYCLKDPIPTSIKSINFKRYSADGSSYWSNETGDITLGDSYVFKVTGWTNSYVSSSYSGAPEFIVEKVNTSAEGE